MTYEEALSYIHSTPNFARGAGLHRIQALLNGLGNPQKQLRFVHIAGTNGKGSTAAMTAAILQAAGYKTGLYTSPYLERFNERMALNGTPISDQALADLTQRLRQAVEEMEAKGLESPNEFERVTALALCWYAQQQAELVVLEVGLGGRYDATNVIDPPEACAITSISLDHTAVLGNTVEEIAGEKGGILKQGSPCVLSADQPTQVQKVIQHIACQVGAPLVMCDLGAIQVEGQDVHGLTFRWQGEQYHLPLLGSYQTSNVCTVLNLVACLRQRGWEIPSTAVAVGLETVRWPGRLELVDNRYLLDCGHNPGGIAALCQALDTTFAGRPVVTVMGMLGDKAYEECLAAVASRSAAFFAVSPPSPRALPVAEIGQVAARSCPEVTCCADVAEALTLANQRAGTEGLVLLCGSIPLVGEGRQVLRTCRQ